MESGKSTIARELLYRFMVDKINAIVLPLAEPVKQIAEEHFGWNRKKDDKGRKLLQVIGTEAGRAYNPDLWIEKLDARIKQQPKETIVIVDDVRFDNEVDYIEAFGGKVFKIERDVSIKGNHISEHGIDYRKHKIIAIDNNGVVDDVVDKIIHLSN